MGFLELADMDYCGQSAWSFDLGRRALGLLIRKNDITIYENPALAGFFFFLADLDIERESMTQGFPDAPQGHLSLRSDARA